MSFSLHPAQITLSSTVSVERRTYCLPAETAPYLSWCVEPTLPWSSLPLKRKKKKTLLNNPAILYPIPVSNGSGRPPTRDVHMVSNENSRGYENNTNIEQVIKQALYLWRPEVLMKYRGLHVYGSQWNIPATLVGGVIWQQNWSTVHNNTTLKMVCLHILGVKCLMTPVSHRAGWSFTT